MPYVHANARLLHGKAKVGDQQCVALVRYFTNAPTPNAWSQGEAVVGNRSLAAGTAIATFEDQKFPNNETDNCAALYLYQVADGMYVVDQRSADPFIRQRFIPRLGRDSSGRFISPAQNADAFSVII